jgi:hypothetical protein
MTDITLLPCPFRPHGCTVSLVSHEQLTGHLEHDGLLHAELLLRELEVHPQQHVRGVVFVVLLKFLFNIEQIERQERSLHRHSLLLAQSRVAEIEREMQALRQQLAHLPALLQLQQLKDRIILDQGQELDELRRAMRCALPSSLRPALAPVPAIPTPPPPPQLTLPSPSLAGVSDVSGSDSLTPPHNVSIRLRSRQTVMEELALAASQETASRDLQAEAEAIEEDEERVTQRTWAAVRDVHDSHDNWLRQVTNTPLPDRLLMLFPAYYARQLGSYVSEQRSRSNQLTAATQVRVD